MVSFFVICRCGAVKVTWPARLQWQGRYQRAFVLLVISSSIAGVERTCECISKANPSSCEAMMLERLGCVAHGIQATRHPRQLEDVQRRSYNRRILEGRDGWMVIVP